MLIQAPTRDMTSGVALIDGCREMNQNSIVERGTTPRQRVVRGTLGGIADVAALHGVRSPATIVVGAAADALLPSPAGT